MSTGQQNHIENHVAARDIEMTTSRSIDDGEDDDEFHDAVELEHNQTLTDTELDAKAIAGSNPMTASTTMDESNSSTSFIVNTTNQLNETTRTLTTTPAQAASDLNASNDLGAKSEHDDLKEQSATDVESNNILAPSSGVNTNGVSQLSIANDENVVIRDLDTDVTCDINRAESVFPEVAAVLTLGELARNDDKKDSSDVETPKVSEAEIAERRKHIGLFSRMRAALSLTDRKSKPEQSIKVKSKNKDIEVFSGLRHAQTIQASNGPIWAIAVSSDGQLVALGGQDSIVRVWVVNGSLLADQFTTKGRSNSDAKSVSSTTTNSNNGPNSRSTEENESAEEPSYSRDVLIAEPYRIFSGHRADVTALDWSADENFLLSASIDKTVRLWHMQSLRCVRVFPHPDFITSIAFHPTQQHYFISGSFDNRLRFWNVVEHRVVEWVQSAHFVTAVAFSPSGNMTVAGLHHGQCVFYQTHGLKYLTTVDCRNRHGKHKKGKKVTGLQFTNDGRFILVSTNDSRIRQYNVSDFSLNGKLKGCTNEQLQIKATYDQENHWILCGSDDGFVYAWKSPGKERSNDQRIASNSEVPATTSPSEGRSGGFFSQYSKRNNNNAQTISVSSPTISIQPSSTSPRPTSSSSTSTNTNTSDKKVKIDSLEYFKASEDTVTCAIFLPPSGIKHSLRAFRIPASSPTSSPQPSASTLRSIILTTGVAGELKCFEAHSFPAPPSVTPTESSRLPLTSFGRSFASRFTQKTQS